MGEKFSKLGGGGYVCTGSRALDKENSLKSNQTNTLSGEAWSRGSVILSWTDVELDSFTLRKGHNIVIHEFSHKLDMLNGRANGMPPLHPKMERQAWTDSLGEASNPKQKFCAKFRKLFNPKYIIIFALDSS